MLKPQRNFVRDLVSLDGFWQFRRDPEQIGESSGWAQGFVPECELAVPGSWNEQRSELMHFFGHGWYQTRFQAGADWGTRGVWLHVGSAQRHARVWLNGELVGSHRGGCLPFECELWPQLRRDGENLLVIEVDGSLDAWDLPPARLETGEERAGFHNSHPAVTYDFFPYAGISRSVNLQLTPTVSRLETISIVPTLAPDRSTATIAVNVSCSGPQLSRLEVGVEIEGFAQRAMLDAKGRVVLRPVITGPRLWDLGQPHLYEAVVTLRENGRVLDAYRQVFGVRTVEIRGDEFLLNGRPVFFTGFGKHEDFAIAGRGLVPPVVVRDFDLLRWVGANSFRTSHYPYAEEWYEFADRHGVLVIAETPFVGLNPRMYRDEVLERARAVLREMMQRDHHHPSVVMWSLANEPDIDTAEGEEFFRTLLADARALDATRPLTYVAHREPEDNRPLAGCDIVCLNKYYGWYEQPGEIEGSLAEFGACLDRFRAAFKKPVLLAEFGADAVAGLHLEPAEMFSEEFQAEIVAAQYHEARRRPWVIGTHVWAFADFKTAQSITRVTMNRKGVFTRDRQPKLAAHRLRELWREASVKPIPASEAPAVAATPPSRVRSV
jgi:beta-glucuronidase